jgi:hypothetical protein
MTEATRQTILTVVHADPTATPDERAVVAAAVQDGRVPAKVAAARLGISKRTLAAGIKSGRYRLTQYRVNARVVLYDVGQVEKVRAGMVEHQAG